MSGLEIFGFVSVTAMLVSYAMERRSNLWVLLFAISCFASSTYAGLIGSIPFCVVEAIWGVVALRRWVKNKTLIHSVVRSNVFKHDRIIQFPASESIPRHSK